MSGNPAPVPSPAPSGIPSPAMQAQIQAQTQVLAQALAQAQAQVQAQAAATGASTTKPATAPVNPNMGICKETYLGSGTWIIRVGGKPLYNWSGLDPNVDTSNVTPLRYRSVDPTYDNKGHKVRTTGLESKFKKGHKLQDFITEVWEHLTEHGLDTVSYLVDPHLNTTVTNVVQHHSKFGHDMEVAEAAATDFKDLYDEHDQDNDRCATKFLLNSIDIELKNDLRVSMNETDPFALIWLKLMHLLVSTSITRFTAIKQSIRNLKPSSYAGQNIQELTRDLMEKATELDCAGYYDHTLSLAMVESFLAADGDTTGSFAFEMNLLRRKVDEAIKTTTFMIPSDRDKHMLNNKLSFRHICEKASSEYRTLVDDNRWPPASLPKDSKAVPKAYLTLPEILTLVQNPPKSFKSDSSSKKGKGACYNCGDPDHYSRDCTKKRSGNSSKDNGQQHSKKEHSWKTTAPKDSEAKKKTVNGRDFEWCGKCRRWSTTHNTSTHTGKRSTATEDTTTEVAHLSFDPSVWFIQVDQPTTSTLPSINAQNAPSNTIPWLRILQCLYLAATCLYFISTHFEPSLSFVEVMHILLKTCSAYVRYMHTTYQCLYAPFTWFLSGWIIRDLNLSLSVAPSTADIIASKPSRKEHRTELRQTRRNRPRRQLKSANRHGLHAQYPLRLRRDNVFANRRQAPSSRQRQLRQAFNRLFNLVLQPDHQTQPCHMNSQTLHNRNQHYNSRHNDNSRRHYQVNAVNSVHGRARSNLTRAQRRTMNQAANVMTTSVTNDLNLQVALMAPTRFQSSLGQENVFQVIWDSGASVSVTNSKADFISFSRKAPHSSVSGVGGNNTEVKGYGTIQWAFHDDEGTLRQIETKAYYIPKCTARLLSTHNLLSTLEGETICIEKDKMVLSGSKDTKRLVVCINPTTNLPTSYAYRPKDLPKATADLFNVITTVDKENFNISEAEKETLRWHQRLGHISFKKVKHLMRTGVLSNTEATRKLHTAACKSSKIPKCAACLYGKQTVRPSPGKTSHTVKDREGILKANNLFPGQEVSVDHFVCSTKGRLFTSYGRTSESNLYCGGCIFVDHASGYIHTEMQTSLSSHETLRAKVAYEDLCRDAGIVIQSFMSDNGSAFTSKNYTEHLRSFKQVQRYAGVGAHHHNAVAERSIRTIMSIARTMMLHSAIHWPEAASATLWPMAVNQATYIWNHVPDPSTGVSPHDIFTKIRWPQKKFHDLHVWGCPTYVLHKKLADGQKIPKWTSRSERMMYMGPSPKHASTVPLVLNLQTGSITPQFHVVFDDWFATIATSVDDLPNLYSDEWYKLFGDSTFQYVLDETEQVDEDDVRRSSQSDTNASRIATAAEQINPHQPLPVPSYLPSVSVPNNVPPNQMNLNPSVAPNDIPRRETAPFPTQSAITTITDHSNINNEDRNSTFEATSDTQSDIISSSLQPPSQVPISISKPTKVAAAPARTSSRLSKRPTRSSKPVQRLTYTGEGSKSYTHLVKTEIEAAHPGYVYHFDVLAETMAPSMIFKAKTNADPDLLNFDQAMSETDQSEKWREAARIEIQSLEKMNTWTEVPMHLAKSHTILPGTWVFKRKRTPDGTIKKHKARYCVRGDLQDGVFDTYAPVVSFSTVRLFLVLSLMFNWETCTVDFANAFVQAELTDLVFMHLPRGFQSELKGKSCLKLNKSIYGLSVAPRLWFKHLLAALELEGFKQSKHDPCLLTRHDMLIIMYVDDLGLAAEKQDTIDLLIDNLRKKKFDLTKEGSFSEYLGIKYEEIEDGKIRMTQKGLIKKILQATGMDDCNPNWVPAAKTPLSKDEDGLDMTEEWNYRSIVGMMLYLTSNTRPDIAYSVSQVARFSHFPKQSHSAAVKTIVRYLARTRDQGTLYCRPTNLSVDCYVDADFAGLYGTENPDDPISAKSRSGYILSIGGCYLFCKSQLQTTIALSTSEAEYYALSQAMRAVLPMREFLKEIIDELDLPSNYNQIQSSVFKNFETTVHEDNSSALNLATKQKVTSRTKHYHVKYHFFWYHINMPKNNIKVVRVPTEEQRADYLTKGLTRDVFQNCRLLNQGW